MNGKSTAYRIVLTQFAFAMLAGLVALAVGGAAAGAAALAGGLINVVANLYFAIRMFGRGVRPAAAVLRGFYAAEAVKLVLTGGLFFLTVVVWRLDVPPLLAGFMVTLAVYWLALLPAGPVYRWINA
jgi:ATP synthase protein I